MTIRSVTAAPPSIGRSLQWTKSRRATAKAKWLPRKLGAIVTARDLADKVGNAGDDIHKDLGNLGDDVSEAGRDAGRKVEDATNR